MGRGKRGSAWEGKKKEKKENSQPATESLGKAWNSSVHHFAAKAILRSSNAYQKHYVLLHGVKVQCTESCNSWTPQATFRTITILTPTPFSPRKAAKRHISPVLLLYRQFGRTASGLCSTRTSSGPRGTCFPYSAHAHKISSRTHTSILQVEDRPKKCGLWS